MLLADCGAMLVTQSEHGMTLVAARTERPFISRRTRVKGA